MDSLRERMSRPLGGPGCTVCAEHRRQEDEARGCAHDNCSKCHGTGATRFGPCLHFLVCRCRKCALGM